MLKARWGTKKGNPTKMRVGVQLPFEVELWRYVFKSKHIKCPVCGCKEWLLWDEEEVMVSISASETNIALHTQVACVPAYTDKDYTVGDDCLCVSKQLEVYARMAACIDECVECGAVFSVFGSQSEDIDCHGG
jgi:hypothetical protein